MAALTGAGTGGNQAYSKRKFYPGVPYCSQHFHTSCKIVSYSDAVAVRNCELVGLKDLDQVNIFIEVLLLIKVLRVILTSEKE